MVIIIVIVIIAAVGLISSSIFDYMILLRFLLLLLSFTVPSHNLACNSQREACMDCGPFFNKRAVWFRVSSSRSVLGSP